LSIIFSSNDSAKYFFNMKLDDTLDNLPI
jgi:hypothetical protein